VNSISSKSINPYIYLTIAIVILSQAANIIRFATAHPVMIGFWRLAFALVLLVPLALRGKYAAQIRGVDKAELKKIFFCAFFLFAHFFFWFYSVQKTTIANAMILFSLNPLFTAIGAWIIFKERAEWRQGIALVLCLLGLWAMVRESIQVSREHLMGDIMGVASSLLFSAYILSGKGIRGRLENIPFAFLTYSFCMILFLIAGVAMGLSFLDHSNTTWLAFLALAVGPTLLGHAMFTHCLKYLNVNVMSCSTLIEPILSAWVAYLLFDEPVTQGAAIGFILVTVGLAVLYVKFSRRVEVASID
jgi:drug/metabolite transporter (DMT)-like permease